MIEIMNMWMKLWRKQLTPGPPSWQGAEPGCGPTYSGFMSSDHSADHHIYWYGPKVGCLLVHCGSSQEDVLLRQLLQIIWVKVRHLILMLQWLGWLARLYNVQTVHKSLALCSWITPAFIPSLPPIKHLLSASFEDSTMLTGIKCCMKVH